MSNNNMSTVTRRALVGAALITAFAVSSASAQQPQTQRVRGTIEKVDGNTLSVKARDGAVLTVALAGNATVVGVVKASLADIKEGSYIGSGAKVMGLPWRPPSTAPRVSLRSTSKWSWSSWTV